MRRKFWMVVALLMEVVANHAIAKETKAFEWELVEDATVQALLKDGFQVVGVQSMYNPGTENARFGTLYFLQKREALYKCADGVEKMGEINFCKRLVSPKR